MSAAGGSGARRRRRRRRLMGGLAALALLAAGLVATVTALPRFGTRTPAYGRLLNDVAPRERHVANVVGAVVFDLRALDTLGEELILLAAVAGGALILRHLPGEERPGGGAPALAALEGRDPGRATGLLSVFLLWWAALVGLQLLLHPHLAPGGGFQGGVLVAGAAIAYFVARPEALAALAPGRWLEAAEAVGVGAFLLAALGGALAGRGVLANPLPPGRYGELASGGMIAPLSAVSGIAVAAGVLLLADELARSRDGDGDGGRR